jgi:hypothetical protein
LSTKLPAFCTSLWLCLFGRIPTTTLGGSLQALATQERVMIFDCVPSETLRRTTGQGTTDVEGFSVFFMQRPYIVQFKKVLNAQV